MTNRSEAEAILAEARALGLVPAAQVEMFEFSLRVEDRMQTVRLTEGAAVETARLLVRALRVLERSVAPTIPVPPMPERPSARYFLDADGRMHSAEATPDGGIRYLRTKPHSGLLEVESRYRSRVEWVKSLANYETPFPGIGANLGGL